MEKFVLELFGKKIVGLRCSMTLSLGDGNFFKFEPFVSRPLDDDEKVDDVFEELWEQVEKQLNKGIEKVSQMLEK